MKCQRCEKEFTPIKTNHRKYCSRDCSSQHSIAICYCGTCGNRFESKHIKKYCSVGCNPHKQALNLPIRVCLTCSQEYKPRYQKQKYCSAKCNPYKPKEEPGFYQSKEWKLIRATFIQSTTLINGIQLSNQYCIECYIKQNRLNDMYAVDHIVRVKDGGTHDQSNLQSLCRHHHQSKSALEGNKERYVSREIK